MISKRQKLFVEEYLISFNATTAALKAGYSPKASKQQGSRLLTYVDIKEEINERCVEITGKTMEKIAYLILFWQGIIDDSSSKPKDKIKASELMAKYLGLFSERLEITGKGGEPLKVIWGE